MGGETKKTIAVEIETGKSDVVSNVKRDLLERMATVWVVATSDDPESDRHPSCAAVDEAITKPTQ